jgi:hypothetical protein
MDQNREKAKRIEEFQNKWAWASIYVNRNIKCEGVDFGDGFYKAKFLTPEGEVIIPNIPGEWIDDCNTDENNLPGEIRGLMKRIETEIRKTRR